MNTKRILFWLGFVVVLALIIWGLIVAINKPIPEIAPILGIPAPISGIDHITGPENAPVTMIEYSDFQCPACQAYHGLVEQMIASSTIPIRFVYRHFPLAQHPNAIPAAMASEAAGVQGKFWDMYHEIFANPTEWTELDNPTEVFIGYANKIGLDIVRFKADLTSSTLKDRITSDTKDGNRIGIGGTPTFFINGKAINNPTSYEVFKKIIENAASGGTK